MEDFVDDLFGSFLDIDDQVGFLRFFKDRKLIVEDGFSRKMVGALAQTAGDAFTGATEEDEFYVQAIHEDMAVLFAESGTGKDNVFALGVLGDKFRMQGR